MTIQQPPPSATPPRLHNHDQTTITIVPNDDSDLDRGLNFLTNFINSHYPGENGVNAVELLFDQNVRNQREIHQLEISKRKWSRTKKLCLLITIAATAYAVFANILDQLLSPNDRRQQDVRIAIVISASLLGVAASFISFIAWLLQGKKTEELEKARAMQAPDNDMVKKIRSIIEAWGALDKARQDESILVDVNGKIKSCFKNIKELPPPTEEKFPHRNLLVSATINLLPDDHPLNQKIIKLIPEPSPQNAHAPQKTDSDSDSTDDPSFHDIGQKILRSASTILQHSDAAARLCSQRWKKIEDLMGGLHVKELITVKGVLVNPLHPNPFHRGS